MAEGRRWFYFSGWPRGSRGDCPGSHPLPGLAFPTPLLGPWWAALPSPGRASLGSTTNPSAPVSVSPPSVPEGLIAPCPGRTPPVPLEETGSREAVAEALLFSFEPGPWGSGCYCGNSTPGTEQVGRPPACPHGRSEKGLPFDSRPVLGSRDIRNKTQTQREERIAPLCLMQGAWRFRQTLILVNNGRPNI